MLSKCQTPPGLWLFLLIEPKPALLIWRSPGSMHHCQSTAVLGEQRHVAFRHIVRHAAVAGRTDQAAAVGEALVLGELVEDLIGRAPDLQLGEKIDEAVEAVLPDVLGVSPSCRVEFGTGFLPPETDAQKALETMSPSRDRRSQSRKKSFRAAVVRIEFIFKKRPQQPP